MPPLLLRRLSYSGSVEHDSTPSCTPSASTFCYYSPPPPPLSSSSSPSNYTNPVTDFSQPPPDSSSSSHTSPLFLLLLLLLPLFLLSFFLFLRRLRRRRSGNPAANPPPPPQPSHELLLYEEGEAENHVWYVRTAGLDAPAIAAIAKWAYEPGAIDSSDCPVCLSGFHSGELLRLLPGCRHAFHLPCIDAWLAARTTCPLCRAPVVPPASGTDTEASSSSSGSSPAEQSPVSEILGGLEMIQIGIRGPEPDLQVLEEERGILAPEIGAGDEIESNLVRFLLAGTSSSQPVRRSVSMDSFALSALLYRNEPEGVNFKDERDDKDRRRKGSALRIGCVHKGVIEMERSLSSGDRTGGRFFRYGRAQSSVLPL